MRGIDSHISGCYEMRINVTRLDSVFLLESEALHEQLQKFVSVKLGTLSKVMYCLILVCRQVFLGGTLIKTSLLFFVALMVILYNCANSTRGWLSSKQRLANKSKTLLLSSQWQIVYSWLQFNFGTTPCCNIPLRQHRSALTMKLQAAFAEQSD